MTAPAKRTRLDAVNQVLRCINEAPVASLTPPLPPIATIADAVLSEVEREVQLQGWTFNTEVDQELVLELDGKYIIPADVVEIVLDHRRSNLDLVFREDPDDMDVVKLYNRAKGQHTFVLPSGLKATLVRLVDFDGTPETFKNYVTIRASRLFRDRIQGPSEAREVSNEEIRAFSRLRETEGDHTGANIFDSWAAGRVINRQYPRLRGF